MEHCQESKGEGGGGGGEVSIHVENELTPMGEGEVLKNICEYVVLNMYVHYAFQILVGVPKIWIIQRICCYKNKYLLVTNKAY